MYVYLCVCMCVRKSKIYRHYIFNNTQHNENACVSVVYVCVVSLHCHKAVCSLAYSRELIHSKKEISHYD